MHTGVSESKRRGLSVPEVAQELGLSERCVWKLIAINELRAVRFGRKATRIMREDVESYIDSRKTRGR